MLPRHTTDTLLAAAAAEGAPPLPPAALIGIIDSLLQAMSRCPCTSLQHYPHSPHTHYQAAHTCTHHAHTRHLNLTCATPPPEQPRADSKPLEAGALRVCAAAACSLAPLDRPACHTRLPLLVTALLKVLASTYE